MKVAVIGCGPAGLAAVHAAVGLDANVTLIAPIHEGPTPQRGPLVLQQPIPGINTDHPDGYIRQIVIGGSILDYRYKLHGDININIQGDVLRPGYHIWDHKYTYRKLWEIYVHKSPVHVIDRYIEGYELARLHQQFDLVVSTAPLNKLCMHIGTHRFQFTSVIITAEPNFPDQPPDTTIFNAGRKFPWIRSALLSGNGSTEWLPGTEITTSAPFIERRAIKKPISTTCTCFPHILRTGRFGAWRNETWVHTAYNDTREALISMDRKAIWDAIK